MHQLSVDHGESAQVHLPFSFTKCCMDSLRNISVDSTMSPTCLAADLYVLLAPTVRQCRRLSWQPSPTNRAFPVVGPRTWNDLPDDVTSAESLSTFRNRLKNSPVYQILFLIISWTGLHLTTSNGPSSSLYLLGHFNNPGLIDWLTDCRWSSSIWSAMLNSSSTSSRSFKVTRRQTASSSCRRARLWSRESTRTRAHPRRLDSCSRAFRAASLSLPTLRESLRYLFVIPCVIRCLHYVSP